MNILITGTSRGIGKYLAEQYLALGHQVFGCNSSGESTISNPQYQHYTSDVSDEQSVRLMIRDIRTTHHSLDVLINNAGIAAMNHFITTPIEIAQKVMDINFMGSFIVAQEAAKLLRKSKHGRIINFTSIASPLNLEGEAAYASSKAAIEKLTKILAKELAAFNITVNVIGPAPIKTALVKGISEKKMHILLNHQAIKRWGSMEDILQVSNFFIDSKSDFITGQTIYLGGVC